MAVLISHRFSTVQMAPDLRSKGTDHGKARTPAAGGADVRAAVHFAGGSYR
jgi:hypothetical protein